MRQSITIITYINLEKDVERIEQTAFLVKFYLLYLIILKFPVISRVGDRFYCQHCNKTVSKSTFYEHQALYGDSPSEYTSHCEGFELDAENDGVIPCWDDEDRLFFSEDDDSGDDNGEDEVVSEEPSAYENESSVQPGQQIQVILKC